MSISAHCGSCGRKLLLGQLTQPQDGFRCPFCGTAFAPAYASVTPRASSRVIAAHAALATALAELASMTGDRLSGLVCKFVRGQDRCSDQALGSAR